MLVDFWTYSCINCIRTIPHVRALAPTLRRRRAGGDRRPHARIRVRARPRQRPPGDRRFRHHLPGRDRQRLDDLARVQQPLLAGALSGRRQGPAPLPPFRRGRQGRDRGRHPPTARRSRRRPAMRTAAAEATGAAHRRRARQASAPARPISASAAPRISPRPAVSPASSSRLMPRRPPSRSANGPMAGRGPSSTSAASPQAPGAAVAIRFKARDLHLVLGSAGGKPVRFRVTLDGQAPGADARRRHRRRRQRHHPRPAPLPARPPQGGARERLFTITFLDPGAEAYAFTFG